MSKEEYAEKSLLFKKKYKGNKVISSYEINEYVKIAPNRKLILPNFMPYLSAYFIGKEGSKVLFIKPYNKEKIQEEIAEINTEYNLKINNAELKGDSSKVKKIKNKKAKKLLKKQTALKEGNWLMRTVGEPPALFDSSDVIYAKEQLKLLYESKGYYHAQVDFKAKTRNKRTWLTFQIKENKPYFFGKISYEVEDENILKLLKQTKNNSYIKLGNRYNSSDLSNERERINNLLKNNGYFDMQRQYIYFEIDSTQKPYTFNVDINLDLPVNQNEHVQYYVKEVNFNIDVSTSSLRDTVFYNDINYIFGRQRQALKLMDRFVRVRPGDLFNSEKTQFTQRNLGNIDIYKFVNINYQRADSNQLVAYMSVSSYKKYQVTTESGLNVNVNQGQSLPGPFINFSFKNRKFFRGFEIFEANVRYSFESQPNILDQQENLRTRGLGVNASLLFPKLILLNQITDRLQIYTPRTRLSVGYSNVNRFEFDQSSLKTSISYELMRKQFERININLYEINYIETRNETADFTQRLLELQAAGNNLIESFRSAIITSSSIVYIYNNNDLTKNKKSKFFKFHAESGGFLLKLFDNNLLKLDGNELFGLPYYEFFKLHSDVRYYRPISKTGTVVWRVSGGISKPVGNSNVLPYEKYLFSGGMSSNRAWRIRRLGPGGYLPLNENGTIDYSIEQPGELQLESNVELRSKLFSFIHGALFVDAGNVWTLQEDPARELAMFKADQFFKQIAWGAGVGLRFDFSFLILRFDVGAKIWDPGRQMIVPFNDDYHRVYNVGIGYPF